MHNIYNINYFDMATTGCREWDDNSKTYYRREIVVGDTVVAVPGIKKRCIDPESVHGTPLYGFFENKSEVPNSEDYEFSNYIYDNDRQRAAVLTTRTSTNPFSRSMGGKVLKPTNLGGKKSRRNKTKRSSKKSRKTRRRHNKK